MKNPCRIALIALALAWLAGGTAAASAEDLVIDNVTLIDGTGQPKREAMSIGVQNGRFTFVRPTAATERAPGRHIDGRGKYLIPGLMDVHIHLSGGLDHVGTDPAVGREALASFLYSGVTTIYDAGNSPQFILGLRADERAGRIKAPHVLATGNLITYPGSHGSQMAIEVDSWPQGAKLLQKHLNEQHPDIAKITYEEHGWGSRPMIPLLPPELMQHIVQFYNEHGIRVTAHTSSELRAEQAIYAGVDSLAHPVIQGPVSDSFVKLMAAKKTPMATTLTIGEGYSRLVEHPEYLDQPLYQASLRPAQIVELRTKTLPEWKQSSWTWWMKLMTPIARENLKKIHLAGGIIAIGTDQSIGPAVHREMELLQDAGILPLDIIKIATLNGARHLGREADTGSVEPGKIADAVLLSADPSADINNAKRIVFVMKDGVLVDEDELPLAGGKRPLRRDKR